MAACLPVGREEPPDDRTRRHMELSMDMQRLRIFCEVYRQRGFSQAARRLKLTQSAVSQQVRALERELGVALFDPQSRASPTAAGDYLFREGNLILATVEDVCRGAQGAGGLGSGMVKFGMIDTAAIEIMPGVLSAFRRAHPEVKVEAVVRASGELMEMVAGHEIEFAIAVTNRTPQGLDSSTVYRDSIVAVVPQGSRFKGPRVSIRELRGEPLILYPLSSHSRMLIEDVFRSNGMVPTVAMEMHYPEAICSLVAQGMGVGLISELSAREQKLRGQRAVMIREFEGVREIGIVLHKRRRPSPQARALMDAVNAAGRRR
ncbi:MAG: LysR family transcriptional regulator [Proteobacteria bacterium]|nr:LysR family transcriptional regulator [Pseudomonadota bacterium]